MCQTMSNKNLAMNCRNVELQIIWWHHMHKRIQKDSMTNCKNAWWHNVFPKRVHMCVVLHVKHLKHCYHFQWKYTLVKNLFIFEAFLISLSLIQTDLQMFRHLKTKIESFFSRVPVEEPDFPHSGPHIVNTVIQTSRQTFLDKRKQT